MCCKGESGYVFVSIDEMQQIAAFLGVSFEAFCLRYARKIGYRFSLVEKTCDNGLACVFLDTNNMCSIYAVRPKQCITFPFWEAHKHLNETALMALQNECPGIYIKDVNNICSDKDK